ncbi:trans-aconitate 2-methyltransferase [Nocardia sp. alder85J]|uniref:trans-aconitate 2-methyltransferase n=1 Tax=Nocardia sp. alder85J TaxID=2862949 RepID=UPI001CD6652E|nr:trans-aconitate 2-methyltransferase [Nocardia sp. alder85J]MCX4099006.1 trans-aconitate 2-methyltransferase [Nocardia sp. alder85J]
MWDPQQYLTFDDHRSRPFFELLNRIGAERPRRVVDLGCGPGHLTGVLGQRWPGAVVEASDSSPEMVAAARARGVHATLLDVRDWQPEADTDVVVTNAVLQWVPGHPDLLRRWAAELPAGAWLALQVPGNFDAPSHSSIREVAARPHWKDRLADTGILEPRSVLEPTGYAALFAAAGWGVDAWETTYVQRLSGDDPVLTWVTGTALRPVRDALDDTEWDRFTTELGSLLRAAYPQQADGSTWMPFRRVFAVAHRS